MMIKMITVKDVMKHKPCPEWTLDKLQEKLCTGKTLVEILEMQDVSPEDRIWCITRFLPNKTNRSFAIWCARRCNTDVKEVVEYIDVIEMCYNGEATEEELKLAYRAADLAADRAAYLAADWAAYLAADWAAYRAADLAAGRAAYRAANRAADRAADWAADWEADRAADWAADLAADLAAEQAAEREKQIAKLKEMINE